MNFRLKHRAILLLAPLRRELRKASAARILNKVMLKTDQVWIFYKKASRRRKLWFLVVFALSTYTIQNIGTSKNDFEELFDSKMDRERSLRALEPGKKSFFTTGIINSTIHKSPEQYRFRFQYDNALTKFTFPQQQQDRHGLASRSIEWLEQFMRNQPTAKHNETLLDPSEKFIVLTCHKYEGNVFEPCGGLVDRLRGIPYYIWLAHQTQRKLLIKHTKPYALEEFFIPPSSSSWQRDKKGHGLLQGGLEFDWRLPDEYLSLYEKAWNIYSNRTKAQMKKDRWKLWHKHIDKNHDPSWNNTSRFVFVNHANLVHEKQRQVFQQKTGLSMEEVWPVIFRRMFQPSVPLGKVIDALADQHDLVPGDYGGVHVRARYPGSGMREIRQKIEERQQQQQHQNQTQSKDAKGDNKNILNMYDPNARQVVHDIGDNAIQCIMKAMLQEMPPSAIPISTAIANITVNATEGATMPMTMARNGMSIYFATDTNKLTQYIIHESSVVSNFNANANENNASTKIVSRPDYSNKQSLHIDTKINGNSPETFYQVFIDLWMLAHTKCMSYGLGGFGYFGSVLSGNHHKCSKRHRSEELGSMDSCPSVGQ